ncbi:hypothetical protein BDR26DRAFT_860496 [Obelidium mucronatum]|nr:hypothetical protein BDR26DRAFT_860496 [Obelidium mucronatum]
MRKASETALGAAGGESIPAVPGIPSSPSIPLTTAASASQSQLKDLAASLDQNISSHSSAGSTPTASQSRRNTASPVKQTSALRKLDDMLTALSFDLGETPEEDAPLPVPLASAASANKKTATRKKSSNTVSPHYSDNNIAPVQPPLSNRPLGGQRNTATVASQNHHNPHQPYSTRHIPTTAETSFSLSSIEKSNNSLRPMSNKSGHSMASEESFSSGELPKSIFKLGSGPLSGATDTFSKSLETTAVQGHSHNQQFGEDHNMLYEDAGGRRETLTGVLVERMFEEFATPPPPLPQQIPNLPPPVVTKLVNQPDSVSQGTDGPVPVKRTGVRSLRPISSIQDRESVTSPGYVAPPVAMLRQQRDSSLRERPASMFSGDRRSISPGTVQNMVKVMGGGSSNSAGAVTVDEAGMDSKNIATTGVEHLKGLNEHGYPTREPILEKTGKIGSGSYNFFISRAALYCTSQKDSSIYAGFPISLHHILGVVWENKKVVVTWYYAKPPPKREPRLTDIDIEFPDLFTNSQWSIKLLSAAFKGNHANEVLAKQAILFVDQEDVKIIREVLKDLIIPILEAAKKPFDIQLIDPEGLKTAIDRLDLQSINSITYLRAKNPSTKTFKLTDECLLAAGMKAKNRDAKQIKVLQPEMDPVEIALSILKEPTQFGQFCIMNTIIKFEKGRVVKSKQRNRNK